MLTKLKPLHQWMICALMMAAIFTLHYYLPDSQLRRTSTELLTEAAKISLASLLAS